MTNPPTSYTTSWDTTSYVSGLLSAGRTVFTAKEAEQALGVGHGAFLDAC